MTRFMLKAIPKNCFKRSKSMWCGGHAIKSVLSSYNLDDKKNSDDYMPFVIHSEFGPTFPWSITRVLKKYDLQARTKWYKRKNKISFLKKQLRKRAPLILLVNYPYVDGKFSEEEFNSIKLHWISLWGYDDKNFYVYDSARFKKGKEIKLLKYPYDEIIKQWSLCNICKPINFLYISVRKPSTSPEHIRT